MKRLRIRPAADADIDAAAFHYEREGGIDLAIEFYAAVENTWNPEDSLYRCLKSDRGRS